MANTKVTGDVIANGTISTVHIADDAITAAKLDSTATGITFADLAVSGNSTLTGNLTVNGTFTSQGIDDNADATAITINGNEEIGIGTTSPFVKLHVETTASQIARFSYNSTNYQDLTYEGSNIVGGSHVFKIAGSEKMRLDASGNVGIGTTSPAEKLHVNSGTGNVPALFESTDNLSLITFKDNNTTTDVGIGADDNDEVFYAGGSERIRIDSSGDLYIGGQTNYGKVTIEQGGDVSGLVINNTTAHRPRLYLRDAGGAGYSEILANNDLYLNASAVGIGVTSPAEKLHIRDASTDADVYIKIANDSRDWFMGVEGSNSDILSFKTHDASNLLNITSSGNVGINETAPAAKLQVSGDRDGVSEYVAILGEDGGANGAANSGNTTPVHKTLLTGYSIPYSGQTNARLTSVGFLEFDSTPGWTGNQRNYALTSGYDMGGSGGPKFAILMGNTQNVEPQLGTNGAVGSGTGDGVNTRVCSYWDNGGNLVVPEGSITVNSGIYVGGSAAANNLDDYEEGTFTPVVNDGTYTYSYRRGHYQKIGNTVYIHIGFKINTASSIGTATASISGLPFTGASWGSYQEPMENVVGGLFATSNLSFHLAFFVGNSSSTLYARTTASNNDTAVSSNQIWQNGTFMKIQLQYTVS